MGWKAQPGSAEATVQQWTSSKKVLGLVFLWLSVLYSAIFVWAGYVMLKPEWRWLVLLPLAFGVGAGFVAESLRRDPGPSRLKWALGIFFGLPPLLKMAGDSGFFEAVRWLIRSANGS
jgi:hypothetical protein